MPQVGVGEDPEKSSCLLWTTPLVSLTMGQPWADFEVSSNNKKHMQLFITQYYIVLSELVRYYLSNAFWIRV